MLVVNVDRQLNHAPNYPSYVQANKEVLSTNSIEEFRSIECFRNQCCRGTSKVKKFKQNLTEIFFYTSKRKLK